MKTTKSATPERVEVKWHFYDPALKKHVTRWLPAVRLDEPKEGRVHVRTDCGKETDDAAPKCVRPVKTSK